MGKKLTHDGKGAVLSEELFFCDDVRNEKATFGKEPYYILTAGAGMLAPAS